MIESRRSTRGRFYRIHRHDRWKIDGIPMQFHFGGKEVVVFERMDGSSLKQDFPLSFIDEIVDDLSRCEVTYDYYTEKSLRRLTAGRNGRLADYSLKDQEMAIGRFDFAVAYRNELARGKSTVKQKQAIIAELHEKHQQDVELYNRQIPEQPRGYLWKKPPSMNTVDNWVYNLELYGDVPMAVIDLRSTTSGNFLTKLTGEQESLIQQCIGEYLAPEAEVSVAWMYERCEVLVKERNAEIDKHNQGLAFSERLENVSLMSESAFRGRFSHIPPYWVAVMRYGYEYADAKFHSTGTGHQIYRPGMVSQGDTWTSDLLTLLGKTKEWKDLTKAEIKKVKHVRVKFVAVIDASCDYLTGVSFSWSENVDAMTNAVRLAVEDKTALAKSYGCKTPWEGVSSNNLVFDNTSVFGDLRVRSKVIDAVGGAQRSIVGMPWLRAKIERFFRTLSAQLLSHFTGRTFGSTHALKGRDPRQSASLLYEELRAATIIWIVDKYHNTEQRRLGMTPRQAWLRLCHLSPPPPPLHPEVISRIFGREEKRKLTALGVAAHGEYYQSPQVNDLYKLYGDRYVDVIIDDLDLGHVLVKVPPKLHERMFKASDPQDRDGWIVAAGPDAWRGASLWHLLEASKKLTDLFGNEMAEGEEARLTALQVLHHIGVEAVKRRGVAGPSSDDLRKRAEQGFHPGLHHLTQPPVSPEDLAAMHLPVETTLGFQQPLSPKSAANVSHDDKYVDEEELNFEEDLGVPDAHSDDAASEAGSRQTEPKGTGDFEIE